MAETKLFSGWVYISRAEDLPGVWVAHCLDFNIVSQGDSPLGALEMVREALAFTMADDIAKGIDSNKRRTETEPSDWELLLKLWKQGRKIPLNEIDARAREHTSSVFAALVTVAVVRAMDDTDAPDIELAVEEGAVRAA